MNTLNAEQAAKLLHLTAKRVRILARAGKLPASRVGRQWLFRQDEIERLVGTTTPAEKGGPLSIRPRNRLVGRVLRLTAHGAMATVPLRNGNRELVALLTPPPA